MLGSKAAGACVTPIGKAVFEARTGTSYLFVSFSANCFLKMVHGHFVLVSTKFISHGPTSASGTAYASWNPELEIGDFPVLDGGGFVVIKGGQRTSSFAWKTLTGTTWWWREKAPLQCLSSLVNQTIKFYPISRVFLLMSDEPLRQERCHVSRTPAGSPPPESNGDANGNVPFASL